jgi:hypothetical protein
VILLDETERFCGLDHEGRGAEIVTRGAGDWFRRRRKEEKESTDYTDFADS